MSSKANGGPAFPVPDDRDPVTGAGICQGSPGMTLRDWFAGQAIVGLAIRTIDTEDLIQRKVARAYRIADAMIRERDRG